MIGKKLIKILQSLEPGEFKRLKRALSSPYFATNSRLLALYDYLKKYYPAFDESKLQKEKLYKKLYPDNDFNESVLRVLVREFSAVVEDFLIMERLKKNKYDRKKLLVNEYGKRNLYGYFKKGTEELVAGLDDGHVKGMEYYRECTGLLQDYCFHPLTNNYDVNDYSLEELVDSLDSYFVLSKYRFTQILRNKNMIFKKKSEYRFFDLLEKEKQDFIFDNSIVQLYRYLHHLSINENDEVFEKMEHLLFPIINLIPRTDCRIIFFIGLNYCARLANRGNVKYNKYQFEWYKVGLENDLMVENEKMSHVTFINIVTNACYMKEFNWATSFIHEYQYYLDNEYKGDAINYSLSTVYVNEERYEEALTLLTTHNYTTNLQLPKRSMTIRAAFELFKKDSTYYGVLQSQLESSKKYFNRNNLFSESKLESNINFIKLVEKLAKKIWENERKKNIRKWLEGEISAERNIVSKRWLIEILSII